MAFDTRSILLTDALRQAQAAAQRIRRLAQVLDNQLAAGPVKIGAIFDFLDEATVVKNRLQQIGAMPRIAEHAERDLYPYNTDDQLDVVADFTAMVGSIEAVRAWIIANVPADASGYLLVFQFGGVDGSSRIMRQFTPAQTTGLRAVLAVLAASILA